MKSTTLVAVLLFLTLPVCTSSCSKEYSVEGAVIGAISGGTAVYSIASSDGSCSIPVVSGNYSTSRGLQANNTIVLQVKVTTIGTYVISTNIANGIQFTTGGNFTTTGLQTITMVGSGIPTGPGTFTFTPPVALGCGFTITFS